MAEEWDDGVSASDDEEADDADMSGSDEDDDANHVGTAGEHRKRSSNAGHAAENKVTSDEDAMLLDGGSGGLSALLQLEVAELLAETRVDYTAEDAVTSIVEQLKGQLMELGACKVTAEKAASGYVSSLSAASDTALPFLPPLEVSIVGSFATQTVTKPQCTLDVAVVMPKKCFHEKDQLNHRYHAKRALYLSKLERHCRSCGLFSSVKTALCSGDARRPCLHLTPMKGTVSPAGFTIRLLPALEPSAFPLRKLSPGCNNLRSAGASVPTPVYNSGILADLTLLRSTEALDAAFSHVPAARDAVVLLKVWARQRGWLEQPGGFSGFSLSLLVARMHRAGLLQPAMSCTQVFRAALQVLADGSKGWRRLGSGSMDEEEDGGSLPSFDDFAAVSKAVLVDSSGWGNVLAAASDPWVAEVAASASASLKLLSHKLSADQAFQAIFLHSYPATASYDCILKVELPGCLAAEAGQEQDKQILAADLPAWTAEERKLEQLVAEGLGSRAVLVRAMPRSPPVGLKEGVAAAWDAVRLVIRVDPLEASRLVDVGPAADKKAEAAKFRKFWGDRAELRRFKDGSILEAVVWECPPSERHLILQRVVEAVASRHCGGHVSSGPSDGGTGLLDRALVPPASAGSHREAMSETLAAVRAMETSAERLGKQLKSLDEVKPGVVMIQPVASVLRHTALWPPAPHPLAGGAPLGPSAPVPRCLEPVELVVQLEGSGSWPEDNIDAFTKTKAAVGLQLAEALTSSFNIPSRPSEQHVDVFVDGFAFRLLLSTEREVEVRKKLHGEAAVVKQPPSLNLALRSWHHGAMAMLDGQHPAFAPTVRLAKRWIVGMMMEGDVAEEAVELLVAHCFCEPGAVPPPGSHVAGFVRFLRLLATHAWEHVPLLVDPHKEISAEQSSRIHSMFEETRRPSGGSTAAMFVSTAFDPASLTWTRETPSCAQVARLKAMATRTASLLQEALEDRGSTTTKAAALGKRRSRPAGGQDTTWLRLFSCPLEPLDAVLLLQKDAITADRLPAAKHRADVPAARSAISDLVPETQAFRKHKPSKMAYAALRAIPEKLLKQKARVALQPELLVGFDPVLRLVEELRGRYGHMAEFCLGGALERLVGIKWKAQAFMPGPLRVPTAHCMLPRLVSGDEEGIGAAMVDTASVLSEMMDIGEGLVSDVVLLDGSSLL